MKKIKNICRPEELANLPEDLPEELAALPEDLAALPEELRRATKDKSLVARPRLKLKWSKQKWFHHSIQLSDRSGWGV